MFKLGIIEESLSDVTVLREMQEFFYSQRIENVPEDEYPVWHVNEYHIDNDKIFEILDLLKAKVKETWYIHTFDENFLYVVLKDKWFKISLQKDSTWDKMIEYGVSYAKVERGYLENIPLNV